MVSTGAGIALAEAILRSADGKASWAVAAMDGASDDPGSRTRVISRQIRLAPRLRE
jgi:hypothetical protein